MRAKGVNPTPEFVVAYEQLLDCSSQVSPWSSHDLPHPILEQLGSHCHFHRTAVIHEEDRTEISDPQQRRKPYYDLVEKSLLTTRLQLVQPKPAVEGTLLDLFEWYVDSKDSELSEIRSRLRPEGEQGRNVFEEGDRGRVGRVRYDLVGGRGILSSSCGNLQEERPQVGAREVSESADTEADVDSGLEDVVHNTYT